ncbi:Hypothetical protein PHPALM_6109 [Phytophthora palmivora]|uniref:Uncharacterized protein n=1 Tax=Phytophthora palmivora TaxID=4796 RepID=A0A2P4YFN7_9STRA|nr:Hypothetical protein PHPALM_6109 [Phytophthora palmivora]
MICLVGSVVPHLELANEMADVSQQALSSDVGEKATTTMRFLRGGGAGDSVDNKVVDNEERGFEFLDDAIGNIALKLGLKASLRLNDTPHMVLNDLQRHRVPMNEQTLLPWMEYVLNYRGKMGDIYADDAYVVKTLSEFIPKSQFSVLFKAMEKNDKLRSFGKDLQKYM